MKYYMVTGIVAEVSWNDNAHQLLKVSSFVPVRVNGEKVLKTHDLQIGDEVQIGWSRFRYHFS